MTLPRGINSAKALQTRTGWPGPLCRRFVKRIDRQYRWRDALQWSAISAAAYVVCLAPVAGALIAMDGPPRIWSRTIFIFVGAAVYAGVISIYLLRRRARLDRVLAGFRAEPWCLECRYPIPPLEQARPICPECGQPVPAEMAPPAAAPALQ